ncbi:hypothetical protein, partial [Janthinobacterium sp. TND4EL3]|uniref:hypothetical protein n=1 Tax=Janthinobacterium sp. TND4EL3 TaxID=1907311 RepID=UPI001BB0A7DA
LCADDSAATSVKVGYRQACYLVKQPPAVSPRKKPDQQWSGFFSSLDSLPSFSRLQSFPTGA